MGMGPGRGGWHLVYERSERDRSRVREWVGGVMRLLLERRSGLSRLCGAEDEAACCVGLPLRRRRSSRKEVCILYKCLL
jgi:hypothetical protein